MARLSCPGPINPNFCRALCFDWENKYNRVKEVRNMYKSSMSLNTHDIYIFPENSKRWKWSSSLNPVVLYQQPLLHQGITQRFIPYRCTSSRKFVLQVGQICFNVCPGFSLLISVCVEQMAKAWWEGWLRCRVSPSGDVLDLYPVVVAACGWGSSLLCEINTADNICVGMLHPCGAQQLHLYKSR